MEAPAPELTIMRYSDDGIDHQLGVVYSEAHPWSVSGGYSIFSSLKTNVLYKQRYNETVA